MPPRFVGGLRGWSRVSNTVLLVESDPKRAKMLREALQPSGCQVHTVPDGLEALRWLRTSMPQLILVEQNASWVDGFRICRLVKFHKKRQHIPVVLMTRVASDEGRRLAETVKADAYVEDKAGIEAVVRAAKQWV